MAGRSSRWPGWRSARRIRVRTGARVPLDARVESGRAALDQAPITGESLPVDKARRRPAVTPAASSPTVCVEATVTAAAGDSTLARIAAAIQDAQSQRAPTQRFVDQFAHYYTPAVVALAVLVAVLGPLLLGGTWGAWLYQALVHAGDRLPLRPGGLHPGHRGQRPGSGGQARHPDQRRGLPGRRPAAEGHGPGQDRHPDPGPTGADRCACPLATCRSSKPCCIAASLDEPSTHPVAQALVRGWRERQPGA